MNLDDVIAHYGSGRSLAFALKTTPQAVSHWRKMGYIPYAKQLVIEKVSGGIFKAEEEDRHSRFVTSKYFK